MTKKDRKKQSRNAYTQNIIDKGQRITIGGKEYAYSHTKSTYGLGGMGPSHPCGLVRISYE